MTRKSDYKILGHKILWDWFQTLLHLSVNKYGDTVCHEVTQELISWIEIDVGYSGDILLKLCKSLLPNPNTKQ